MRRYLPTFFERPRFRDPQEDRVADSLHVVVLVGMGASALSTIISAVTLPDREGSLFAFALVGLTLAAHTLLRYRRLYAAGFVVLGAAFTSVGVALFYFGGVQSHLLVGTFAVIIPAGFIFGATAAIGVSVLCVGWALAAVVAEWAGLIGPAEPVPSAQVFQVYALTIAVTSAVLVRALRRLRDSLDESQRARQRYAQLVEEAPLGVLVLDTDLRVRSVNERAAEFLSLDAPGRAIGRPVGSLLRPGQSTLADAAQRCLADGTRQSFEAEIGTAGQGRSPLMNVHAAPLSDTQGGFAGVQLILEDVSERRALEERLRQSQKLEAVGSLAGGIAHDFNNFLTVILGAAESLRDPSAAPDDERDELVDMIHGAAESSADLTRQLLAFGRRQALQPRVLELNELLRSSERLLRRVIPSNVRIQMRTAAAETRVRVDPTQFEQVIMNLAINARDAMPDGGTLTLETGSVLLDAEYAARTPGVQSGPHALIAVSDTGQGISDDARLHIFEPFYSTKERLRGSGLGLPTVLGIVQQSGGTIDVISEVGVGTTFRIYLPCVEEPADATPATAADASPLAGLHGDETILVAEDQPEVRALLRSMLERNGYSVLEAADGRDALDLVEAGHPFDALVTDVVMPRVGGLELAELLGEKRRGVPVVFISGYVANDPASRGLDPQAALVRKPFTAEKLIGTLRQALDAAPSPD